MFVRLLFLLLLALNVGAGAWLLLGHGPSSPPLPVSDPGVPALQLLSEVPARTAPLHGSRAAAPAPLPALRAPREACHALGPFTTRAGVGAAMDTLAPHVARIQYRQQQLSRSRGYWVYLPAAATREEALAEARALAAKGIQDYYMVTAGDAQNTISLGLYNDETNARNRLVQLQQDGFAPKLEQRIESEPVYWIDYAVPAGTAFAWQTWIEGRSDLHAEPVACF